MVTMTKEGTELNVAPQATAGLRLGTWVFDTPDQMLEKAKEVAALLKTYIDEHNLAIQQGESWHVQAEGWGMLAALIGTTPVEEKNVHLDEGGYESTVALITYDGVVIGRASMICSPSEPDWANSPEYSIKSMATTRAMSKVCRIVLSWIMKLSGYHVTPAEEIGAMRGRTTGDVHDPGEFIVTLKKAKEQFNGRAPTINQLFAVDPGLVQWIADKIHDGAVGTAARKFLEANPLPAQDTAAEVEKMTDEQVALKGEALVERMKNPDLRIDQNIFWSFATAARFDRGYADEIRLAHTDGKTTNWRSALIGIFEEWNRSVERSGEGAYIIDYSSITEAK